MASKEATPAAAAPADKKTSQVAAPTFALEFKLLKDKIGAATTNQQVKSKVKDAFTGYGALDQCRVQGDVGADRTVVVFFTRLMEGKGKNAWDALQKGETVNISLYDEQIPLSLSAEKPSGGGATSGTATGPKKEKKDAKKGPRGEKKDGEGKADGKEDSKDGKRLPRGPKKEEVKGPSLQRGRANIGGKLGPMSKIRLAKLEKEKKDKEIAEKKAAGTYVEEVKVVEEDPSVHLVKKGGKDVGKKEDAKKGGDAKKEAGKKGEAAKAPAKAAAPAKKK